MEQIIFLITAAISVVAALGVIFNKNVVHSALLLLVNFCALAVFYFMLNAEFLAVAQILVYAGAIVVLFLFVVMLLGAELGETISNWLTWQNGLLAVLGLILLTVIGTAVFENYVYGAHSNFSRSAIYDYGHVQMIGSILFTDYVLAFQLVAVLLSVGIIGVVWLAQQQRKSKIQGEAND